MPKKKDAHTPTKERIDLPRAAAGFFTAVSANAPMSGDQLPGDIQIRVDVHICLLDAMTDLLPITRASIGADTVPSKTAGLDSQGWEMCLARFDMYLSSMRPVYGFYVHKPRYTIDTFAMVFPNIVIYLKDRVAGQFLGNEP